MPFNPTIHTTNDGLARGIAQGAQALAAGLQGYYQKQEEKKLNEQATSVFQKYLGSNPDMAKSIGLQDPTDTKAIGAMIKSLGGPAKAMEFGANAMQMQEMQKKQQEQAAVKARMESMLRMSQNPQGPLSNANAAQMQDPAAAAAIKAYGFSGDPRMATEVYGEQMKQMAANAGRAPVREDAISPFSYRGVDEKGNPIEITKDKRTGAVIGQGPVNQPPRAYPGADEVRGIKMAEKDAENESKMNFDYVNDTINSAKSAKELLASNQKVLNLYKDGAKTGWGQDFLTSLGSFGVSAGLIKKEDQAKQEQLRTAFAVGQLANAKEFMKGMGATTESERTRVDNAGARFENQDLANLNIIGTTMALANHRIAKERERQRLYDSGIKSGADVAEKLRRWELDNSFDQFFPQEVTQVMDQIQRQDTLTKKGNPIKGAPR